MENTAPYLVTFADLSPAGRFVVFSELKLSSSEVYLKPSTRYSIYNEDFLRK